MPKKELLTNKDIEDGRKLNCLFDVLSETSKTMALVYLSALRDKELVEIQKAG